MLQLLSKKIVWNFKQWKGSDLSNDSIKTNERRGPAIGISWSASNISKYHPTPHVSANVAFYNYQLQHFSQKREIAQKNLRRCFYQRKRKKHKIQSYSQWIFIVFFPKNSDTLRVQKWRQTVVKMLLHAFDHS